MNNNILVKFSNVSVSRNNTQILNNISFTIKKNEKTVFVGPSGCGKSTIIMSLLGFTEITSGKITMYEQSNTPISIQNIRKITATVFQDPVLPLGTVYEALLYPFHFKANLKKMPRIENINQILSSLKLSKKYHSQQTHTLSGGEKQRIAIATALLMRKKTLLLDEFTSSLDHESKESTINMLLKKEISIISVSHDREWINKCDKIIHMQNGTILD